MLSYTVVAATCVLVVMQRVLCGQTAVSRLHTVDAHGNACLTGGAPVQAHLLVADGRLASEVMSCIAQLFQTNLHNPLLCTSRAVFCSCLPCNFLSFLSCNCNFLSCNCNFLSCNCNFLSCNFLSCKLCTLATQLMPIASLPYNMEAIRATSMSQVQLHAGCNMPPSALILHACPKLELKRINRGDISTHRWSQRILPLTTPCLSAGSSA